MNIFYKHSTSILVIMLFWKDNMKFKIKAIPGVYTESGQKNPIRWMVLHQTGEQEFENTTNWFRCKRHSNSSSIYRKHGRVYW